MDGVISKNMVEQCVEMIKEKKLNVGNNMMKFLKIT